jgi:hypothetical protein
MIFEAIGAIFVEIWASGVFGMNISDPIFFDFSYCFRAILCLFQKLLLYPAPPQTTFGLKFYLCYPLG